MLKHIGLEDRELVAEPDLVAKSIRDALPPSAREFVGGKIPRSGFGIGGVAGCGKTCAMVVLLKLHLRAKYRARPEGEGHWPEDTLQGKILWVDWPRVAHQLRTCAVSNPDFVFRTVEAMSKVRLLILDDLGAERRKGDYQDDYAAAELDYIVSSCRYRNVLPTTFTTNLEPKGLASFYGSRFASRLLSESPLAWTSEPDRRTATSSPG